MARSYTRITLSTGDMPRWTTMPLSFWVNERGSPQISNASEFEAVFSAFRTWEAVSTADVSFRYRGTTSVRTAGRDGVNLVSFTDDTTLAGSSSTIALTISYFRADANNKPQYDEADIVFNPTLLYSTSGESGKFDIQSVLTHEIGHFVGLDHAAMVSSVMVPFGSTGQVHQRTLSYDDVAAVSEIYPKSGPPVGGIRGSILSGALPVFGANVVAVDTAGTAWVSTLSQPSGSFELKFLPPGTYTVYAEPLDQPVTEQNVGGGSTSWYRNLKTDFGTTYYGNVSDASQAQTISVFPSATVGPINIQVLPKSSTGLNLTRPAFAPRVPRGASGVLTIGGVDITSGTQFSISSPDIFIGGPTYGGSISSVAPTSAAMDLSVAGNAVLGPRNITVMRGADASIVSGALVIVDRQPVLSQISPASGTNEGGTTVQITGANFREGLNVYFGGLPALDVAVIDSSNVIATTPRNTPGAANVQIINADGTNGLVSRGFNYLAQPPTIIGFAPLSGPPATEVTIDGTQFDSSAQNIDVRFNGVSARVVSATPIRIIALVPYGASSGPLSVSVFGQIATAAVDFTVTPAIVSANHASESYAFVDSTPAKGGTSVAFQWGSVNDDGLATLPLPFTFSLFKDIYLSGTNITISSNGWISLEPVTDPYTYQNGRLPAASAVDSSGVARTIPPSLIAPFHDDLALIPGVSSVSTRLAGTAPNRQLIVQWTNLTILDDDGRDQNARITFEAILFEGSNDIEFLYPLMTGSRSNGSSATVGLQNFARNTAVLTSFNEPKLASGYFVAYRFGDGAYVAKLGDSTPPPKPVVVAVPKTSSMTSLSASWFSSPDNSNIREYQYAIGRTSGGTEVLPFTSTTQNSAAVTGLSLDAKSTYYFAVRAVSNSGIVSEIGLSSGTLVDPSYQPDIRIIPSAPQSASEFSTIKLLARSEMSVVLKALDSSGNLIAASGVRNPVAVTLAAGEPYVRVVQDLFGLTAFDGWIEIEVSTTGLSVYTSTASSDALRMDGSVSVDTSRDFIVFHPGATVFLVNPSTRSADVTISEFGSPAPKQITISPRTRISITPSAASRIRSTEALASLERFGSTNKLGISSPVPATSARTTVVIPHGLNGNGYVTTVMLANLTSIPVDIRISFAGLSSIFRIDRNSAFRASLPEFFRIPANASMTDAVRIDAIAPFGTPRVVAVADIENASSLVSIGAPAPATDATFPVVRQGDGFYSGLSIATGSSATRIDIAVYGTAGAPPATATITIGPNQQIAKVISALVPSITSQNGGYIHLTSDQPVWAWEIYGNSQVMVSAPPF